MKGLKQRKLNTTFRQMPFPGLFLIVLALLGCQENPPDVNPLPAILASETPAISRVMRAPENHEIQIRYSQIRRTEDSVTFVNYDYQVDDTRYFYPASTVKFPVALAALEKLHELDSLNLNTRYYIEGDTVEQSFADDITAIFAVSDNHANNRLVEFLGQDDINRRIGQKGAGPFRLSHRLGFHRDELSTRPLVVYLGDSLTTLSAPIQNSPPEPLEFEGVFKGSGFYDGDSLMAQPFDFRLKNYLPVTTLDGLIKRLIFPEAFSEKEQLRLSDSQRAFLLEHMQILPREAGYDPVTYPDGYCKFFLYGDSRTRIPEHMEVYNKVGFAYGTLTDCAYILDRQTGVEFFLTATILVNRDGVFNDDQYEYEEVGLPFLAALGRKIYEYERHKRR